MASSRQTTAYFFDVDGPLITADTGDVLPPMLETRLVQLLERGDAVILNSGRLSSDIVDKVMRPVLYHLRLKGVDANKRFMGYAEKGLVFVASEAVDIDAPISGAIGEVRREDAVPPQLTDAMRKQLAKPPFVGFVKLYEGKQTMVTVDRDRSFTEPSWQEIWDDSASTAVKRLADALLQWAEKQGIVAPDQYEVVVTRDAVDIQPTSAGKHIGVTSGLARLAENGLQVSRAVAFGDSLDDDAMGAALSEWVRRVPGRSAVYVDVNGNQLAGHEGVELVLSEGLMYGTLDHLDNELIDDELGLEVALPSFPRATRPTEQDLRAFHDGRRDGRRRS